MSPFGDIESSNILTRGVTDPDAKMCLAVAHSLVKISTGHNEEQSKHRLAAEQDAEVQAVLREAMMAVRRRR